MKLVTFVSFAVFAVSAPFLACTSGVGSDLPGDLGFDSGIKSDTGVTPKDSGTQLPPNDSGNQPNDSGSQPNDSGNQPSDSGNQPIDAGKDTGVTKTDAGPKDAAAGACGPLAVNYTDLKSGVPASRAGTAAACTAADINAARNGLKGFGANSTLDDLANLFKGTCAACAIQDFADGEPDNAHPWGPLTFFKNANGNRTGYIDNTEASCVATLSLPINPACGKAISTFNVCENVACNMCTIQADQDQCRADAYDKNTGTCFTGGSPDITNNCTAADLSLIQAGGRCSALPSDKTNGDVWVTRIGATCGGM